MKLQVAVVTIASDPPTDSTEWPELRQQRRAIVVVDVVESVRLMQANEADVIDRWRRFVHEVRTQVLPVHGGRLVKSLGDGLLLEFENVTAAVQCALDIQATIARTNLGYSSDRLMCLRVGAHLTDVVVDELDIYGVGVNLAARVATLAGPGEIVVSAEVRDGLVPGVDADVEDLGECFLKHVEAPVRAYRVGPVGPRPMVPANNAGDLRPTIVVVPFTAVSSHVEGAALGDILADDVISALARSDQWHVISRLSSSALSRRAVTPQGASGLMRADYALSGRYRSNGTTFKLDLQLSDARDGHVVWVDTVTAVISDLFEGDEELLQRIVAGVSTAILRKEMVRIGSLALPSLEGYSILMRGIALMHRMSRPEVNRASEALQYLIERHPRAPEPRAWLAKWHVMKVAQTWTNDPLAEAARARSEVLRALDLTPHHALALAIDGLVYAFIERDLDLAQRRYAEALLVNPNESLAWLFSSSIHAHRGDGVQAEACVQRACRLSPIDPMGYYFDGFAAWAALAAGKYDDAENLATRSLRANRTHLPTFTVLAQAQSLAGHAEAARETASQLKQMRPDFSVKRYVANFPGGPTEYAQLLGNALAEAGLPP